MYKIEDLLDLSHTIAAKLFEGKTYPWEALADIKGFILALGPTLPAEEFDHPAEGVWIAKDAEVFPSAYIGAPCIIDHNAEVRHCAFIRGSAIVGKNCVVGNSVELKNAVLFQPKIIVVTTRSVKLHHKAVVFRLNFLTLRLTGDSKIPLFVILTKRHFLISLALNSFSALP